MLVIESSSIVGCGLKGGEIGKAAPLVMPASGDFEYKQRSHQISLTHVMNNFVCGLRVMLCYRGPHDVCGGSVQ